MADWRKKVALQPKGEVNAVANATINHKRSPLVGATGTTRPNVKPNAPKGHGPE